MYATQTLIDLAAAVALLIWGVQMVQTGMGLDPADPDRRAYAGMTIRFYPERAVVVFPKVLVARCGGCHIASTAIVFACSEVAMARLAGKVALITGAGTGIGRATALLFARNGARVVIADIDMVSGEETARLAGGGAIAVQTDVTEPDSIERAIRVAVDHFGGLHVLHNNAGGATAADNTAVDAPLDEFWRAIKLDLYGTFLGCRFGIPAIIASGGGSVINMTSSVALIGVAGRDCYTAAKGGIAAITRSLAVAYAPSVRVNAIAPSATMTDRVKRLVAGNLNLQKLADSHLVGLIEPDDIANCALYLASDEARRVTGQVLPVDSGATVA